MILIILYQRIELKTELPSVTVVCQNIRITERGIQ